MRPQLSSLDEFNESLGEINGQYIDLKAATDYLYQTLLKEKRDREILQAQMKETQTNIRIHKEYIEHTNRERVKLEVITYRFQKEFKDHKESQTLEDYTILIQVDKFKKQIKKLKFYLSITIITLASIVIGASITKLIFG